MTVTTDIDRIRVVGATQRFFVTISKAAIAALRERADRNYRDPRHEAAYILEQCLLAPDEPDDGDGAEAKG